jgi:hypothetical protein
MFNPFIYIAGWKALLIGVIAILITGHIGSYSNTHFDGVLDVHSGWRAPQWFFLTAGLIDWLCMGTIFWIIGRVVVKKPFRAIDVFGTQALARWPVVFTALATLPPAYTRFTHALIKYFRTQSFPDGIQPVDIVVFGGAVVVMLLVLVWMIRLMFNSYKISCDPDRGKAGWTFVVGLVIAEVVSKIILIGIMKQL